MGLRSTTDSALNAVCRSRRSCPWVPARSHRRCWDSPSIAGYAPVDRGCDAAAAGVNVELRVRDLGPAPLRR